MHRAKSSVPSVMAAGFPSRQASYGDAKPSAQLESKTTSPTPVASGSMNPPSVKDIWSGAELSKIFQTSAGNWLLPLLNRQSYTTSSIKHPWGDWRDL